MTRGTVASKAVAAVLAVAALALLPGCSSPSQPTSSSGPSSQLTGSMDQWLSAVCEQGSSTTPVTSGRYLRGATNPTTCLALMDLGNERQRVPLVIGTYASESAAESDLGGERLGPYAEGNDGTEEIVISTMSPSDRLQPTESTMLNPLATYGFTVHPSPNPMEEPQAPTTPTTYANAMPPQTPTPTDSQPSETSPRIDTAEPYWDGPWLRNYWEDRQDCTSAGLNYWVVQPGDDTGMYSLKKACLPPTWMNAVNTHCQSLALPRGGRCAVWDQDAIMSSFGKHGDLLIVVLTQACLDRAGLTDFHEGPLHQDCVARS
jgi:hypothetical protein